MPCQPKKTSNITFPFKHSCQNFGKFGNDSNFNMEDSLTLKIVQETLGFVTWYEMLAVQCIFRSIWHLPNKILTSSITLTA